jgi:phosphatidylglycerol:prolipoprotein diacylglycerol transferase
MWTWKRRQFAGQVFGTYAFLYGTARYFLEFYRDDPERGSMLGGIMTTTQFVSLLLVIVGGILWMKRTPKTVTVASN